MPDRAPDTPGSDRPAVRSEAVEGAADIDLPPWLEDWLAQYGAVTAVCGLLVLLVAIVFGQTLRYDFIDWDDPQYVIDNPLVHGGLSVKGIVWAFTERYEANWHPVTWISHMLDWQMYGSWAGGHHLTSVLLHALTAILLFLALRRMTGRLECSALVAILFAIHPLRAESVAWVAERKDILSGFFFALTLWAYAGYAGRERGAGSGGRWAWYGLAMGSFALGLMAKPMLVTLPFVLLLLDYWPLRRVGFSPAPRDRAKRAAIEDGNGAKPTLGLLILEKLPLLVLAAVSCALTIWAQQEALEDVRVHSLGYRVANALVAYGQYISGTFWPANLAAYYPFPQGDLPGVLVAVSGVAVLGISVAVIWAGRRFPYLFSGWFWYLGMLVPVIGLMQVGGQARADRYTYLPQIGLLLALVWGADSLWQWRRLGSRLARVAAGLVVLIFVVCAARQVSFWHDSETLWRHVLACTTENSRAHAHLASILGRRGVYVEAIDEFKIAFDLEPNQAGFLNNYGITLREAGRFDEAIRYGRQAVELSPNSPMYHENLAAALMTRGRMDEAIGEYQKQLELQPDAWQSRFNLARIYTNLGRQAEAVGEFRAILAGNPDFPHIHFYLANALASSNALDAAIEEYRQALAKRPEGAEIWHNLGMTLQRRGRLSEALGTLYRAVERLPSSGEYRYHMAVVLREIGKGPESLDQLRQAVALAPYEVLYQRELAAALMAAGLVSDAVVHYRAITNLAPNDADARRALGRALTVVGQTDEAIDIFHGLVKARPKDTETLNGLALALLKKGKTADAIAQYREILKIAPADAEAQRGLGSALLGDGKTDEALSIFRGLVKAQPKDPGALNGLALSWMKKGNAAEAIRVWETLVKVDPQDAEARHNLAGMLIVTGRAADAVAQLQQAVASAPANPVLQRDLADALTRSGHSGDALAHYRAALGIAPGDVEALRGFGMALFATGKTDEAIDAFRRLVAARPKDAAARHNLGGLLLATGRIAEAVVQMREELRANPAAEGVMSDLAWVLATSPDAALRNGKEAVQLAQQAVKLSGGKQPSILDTLAAAYAEAGQFPDAVRTAEEALQLATAGGNGRLADSLRNRIKLYGEGKPWRDVPPPEPPPSPGKAKS